VPASFAPITLEQAKELTHGVKLYHATLRNADGSALRARVNGQVKTWKRSPARVEVPLKHGLYVYLYLRAGDPNGRNNLDEWALVDPTRAQETPRNTQNG